MSSVQYLREFISERLTAAAEEIFTVFEKTIVQYEEEVDRQRRLLETVLKPEIKLHRIELPQQHVCKEEEVCQQLRHQERNSSLDQEEQEPPQIKEEQEEMCTSQEGEHEKKIHENTSDYVEKSPTSETDSDTSQNKTPFQCDTCGKGFVYKGNFTAHLRIHTGEKPNSKICNTHLAGSSVLDDHMYCLAGAKPYSCQTCGKRFSSNKLLYSHMRIHTGENIYCSKRFGGSEDWKLHMKTPTGEKPYCCPKCGRGFTQSSHMKKLFKTHTC